MRHPVPSPIETKIGPATLEARICGICSHHDSAYDQQYGQPRCLRKTTTDLSAPIRDPSSLLSPFWSNNFSDLSMSEVTSRVKGFAVSAAVCVARQITDRECPAVGNNRNESLLLTSVDTIISRITLHIFIVMMPDVQVHWSPQKKAVGFQKCLWSQATSSMVRSVSVQLCYADVSRLMMSNCCQAFVIHAFKQCEYETERNDDRWWKKNPRFVQWVGSARLRARRTDSRQQSGKESGTMGPETSRLHGM
jgi:hypothetical protein